MTTKRLWMRCWHCKVSRVILDDKRGKGGVFCKEPGCGKMMVGPVRMKTQPMEVTEVRDGQ